MSGPCISKMIKVPKRCSVMGCTNNNAKNPDFMSSRARKRGNEEKRVDSGH
uniref:Uncharacterized protein n=1 Tax=Anguilla anguilla TaxID=7936 RepID=A0A0E9RZ95_ANGAN